MAVGSVFAIASSPAYYYEQFEKTGVYAQVDENGVATPQAIPFIGGDDHQWAEFTDEQLNRIIDHIIEYLFTDAEDFTLVMDGVKLNGVLTDDVYIFGEIAVVHMQDVKELLHTLGVAAVIAGITAAALLIYFFTLAIKGKGGKLLKSTVIFYATFVGIILLFCLFTLIQTLFYGIDLRYYLHMLWRNFLFLIFPDPEKAMGSFFNDTLTIILSLDLFMAAVVRVLLIIAASVGAWLGLAWAMDRRVKKLSAVADSKTEYSMKGA